MIKKKFVIEKNINQSSDNSEIFPIDWSFFPDSFLDKISKYLVNVSAIVSDDTITEKTVVYLKKVDDDKIFDDNYYTIELENMIIGVIK